MQRSQWCAIGAAVLALAGCATPYTAQNTRVEQCKPTSTPEIAALFEHWNQALQTAPDAGRKRGLLPLLSEEWPVRTS